MDSAGSLVALIGFALSSTKTIYDTVSGIRQGPRVVNEAAQSPQNALNPLESIKADDFAGLPADLEETLQGYQNSLEAFQVKVEKLRSLPSDGAIRRSWKRLKTVLKEKDLESLHQTTQEFAVIASAQRQSK